MKHRIFGLTALLLLQSLSVVVAQNITGTITGEVRDPSNAALPGAVVRATNLGTNITYTSQTTAAGVYVIPLLPLGGYEVTVESKGFKRFVRTNLVLAADQRLRVDATLELGSMAEQVTVSAEAPALRTDQATVGNSFTPSQIENLPVGRDVFAVMISVPGVQESQRGMAVGNINGSRANYSDYEMDGLSTSTTNINDAFVQPITEMVEELVVQTAQYTAESGRGAAQVSLTTRPGTNEFHGTLFHFFRNDALNANSFMNNALGSGKPKERYNLFGATLGGPVVVPRLFNGRNRAFFNVGYEGRRQRGFAQAVSSVPTAAMREGDFTGMGAIYDPATTERNPAGSGYVRRLFPANRIPSSRIDPIARNMFGAAYPLQNRSGLVNNFVREGATPTTANAVNVRGDIHLSNASRLSLRYIYRKSEKTNLMRFEGPAGAGSDSDRLFENESHNAAGVDHTYLFTPSLINNFRFGVYKSEIVGGGPGTFEGWPAKLGLKNAPGDKFPVVTISGLSPFGGSNVQSGFPADNWNISDSITWIRGRHSVKTGFEYRHLIFLDARSSGSSFGFDNSATWNPLTSRDGDAFASFLLGIPRSSSVNLRLPEGFDLRWHYLGGFVHDDIKVSGNLTLNVGLRWETTTPRKESNDYQSVFDLASRTLKLAGRDGYPRTLRDTDWMNFSPRFGFAYLPFAGAKTVIRGGYGIFMAPSDVTGNSHTLGPWNVSQAWQTSDNGITFPLTLSTAFPLVVLDPKAPFAVNTGTGVSWMPRAYNDPYMQQWSLNLQRELPGAFVVEGGYVGSRGVHLEMSINLNQVPPELLGPGNAQLRRPYPEVNAVNSGRSAPIGASTYHALQFRVERRLQDGVAMHAAYTLSKSIDNASGVHDWRDYGFSAVQNNHNLRAERSVSGFDRTHNLGFDVVWQLPFGSGRKYLDSRGALGHILGGWNLSTLSTIRTGRPLVMGTQGNRTGSLGGGSRPNRLDDTPIPESRRSRLRWFNPAGFELPAQYVFGNSSRTEPRLRGPGNLDLDFMLAKEFRFNEDVRLQLRSEFFNSLNHYNPGMPNTSIGNLAAGVITGGNAGRVVQLSLRLHY